MCDMHTDINNKLSPNYSFITSRLPKFTIASKLCNIWKNLLDHICSAKVTLRLHRGSGGLFRTPTTPSMVLLPWKTLQNKLVCKAKPFIYIVCGVGSLF